MKFLKSVEKMLMLMEMYISSQKLYLLNVKIDPECEILLKSVI